MYERYHFFGPPCISVVHNLSLSVSLPCLENKRVHRPKPSVGSLSYGVNLGQYIINYVYYLWSNVFVCRFGFCLLPYLKNHTSKFHQIFYTCYLWPWIRTPLTARAIRYVLSVLWMTSCFPIMVEIGRIKDDAYVSSSSLGGGTKGNISRLRLHLV